MDKLTIIKMLLASQEEDKKLHEKLDLQEAKHDELAKEASEREGRLNKSIDELTQMNSRAAESQIKMMDQLTDLHPASSDQADDRHARRASGRAQEIQDYSI